MPLFIKKQFQHKWALWLLCFTVLIYSPAKGLEGIDTYYLRLDLKSSSHRITRTQLTMVPAENEFRAEKFSLIPVSGLVLAGPQESNQTLDNLAKRKAFKRLLEQHGLKSVKTHNQDTIISYEGLITTPITLKISPYNAEFSSYPYAAEIQFTPIAFPDQWDTLKTKFRIKQIFHDFILLFK